MFSGRLKWFNNHWQLTNPDARMYGTSDVPNPVEKAAGTAQDKLNME